jgi:TPR repeat protein
MPTRTRKPNWIRVMARLRRRAVAGDIAAITDLGLNLLDGIQDRNGRCLVRRNSVYAVRLLRRAAESGDRTAAGSLGYAYDVGKGVGRDTALALKWYRRAADKGDSGAASNIATVYRDRGDLTLAHAWVLRAMKMGDRDAAVTAGYGYLNGIGARRDLRSARRMFRRALAGDISEHGREEALYNLAIAHVDSGNRGRAIPLLEQANKDDDYPEAASLLAQIRANAELRPCRCRRHLNKHLRGHAKCPQHPASMLDQASAG